MTFTRKPFCCESLNKRLSLFIHLPFGVRIYEKYRSHLYQILKTEKHKTRYLNSGFCVCFVWRTTQPPIKLEIARSC